MFKGGVFVVLFCFFDDKYFEGLNVFGVCEFVLIEVYRDLG